VRCSVLLHSSASPSPLSPSPVTLHPPPSNHHPSPLSIHPHLSPIPFLPSPLFIHPSPSTHILLSSPFSLHLPPITLLPSPSRSPFTHHLSPPTLSPSPFTLHPSHFSHSIHFSPFIFHSLHSPFTLHISQSFLHPSPFTLHPSPWVFRHAGAVKQAAPPVKRMLPRTPLPNHLHASPCANAQAAPPLNKQRHAQCCGWHALLLLCSLQHPPSHTQLPQRLSTCSPGPVFSAIQACPSCIVIPIANPRV